MTNAWRILTEISNSSFASYKKRCQPLPIFFGNNKITDNYFENTKVRNITTLTSNNVAEADVESGFWPSIFLDSGGV